MLFIGALAATLVGCSRQPGIQKAHRSNRTARGSVGPEIGALSQIIGTTWSQNLCPTMFVRIGVMRALNRHVERVFNPSRKDTHWGRQKTRA
jgi:hypothetical protein